MATIQKTSAGRFCATIRIKGTPTISKTFRTKTLAKQWADKTESSIRDGLYQTETANTYTVRGLIDRFSNEIVPFYKNPRRHLVELERIGLYFGEILLGQLTPEDIVNYVAMRRKSVSSATVKKEVDKLNKILVTAQNVWRIPFINPVPAAKAALRPTKSIASSPPRTRRLNDGEEARLMAGFRRSEALIVTQIALATARRLNEIISIKKSDITRRDGRHFMRVTEHKTGNIFEVPITSEISYLLSRRGDRVFNISSGAVTQAFKKACERAGIEDLTFRDLRREALSRLFERGFTVPEVQAISGHKTVAILLNVYSQVQKKTLADKLNQL